MGLKLNVDFPEYLRTEGVNHSTLKLFARSAAHARAEMLEPRDPTPALDFGSMFHTCALEPAALAVRYVVAPKFDKRTKVGKAGWADFQARYPHQEIVAEDDYEAAQSMLNACWRHEAAADLLSSKGAQEIVATWQDPVTGLACKARWDRLTQFAGVTTIVDIKTTEDASPRGFERSAVKYGYDTQAAFYLQGAEAIAPGVDRRFVFVAVEKSRPWAVACYEPTPEMLDAAATRVQDWLQRYKAAKDSGIWPGYPEGILPLDLPAWMRRDDG